MSGCAACLANRSPFLTSTTTGYNLGTFPGNYGWYPYSNVNTFGPCCQKPCNFNPCKKRLNFTYDTDYCCVKKKR